MRRLVALVVTALGIGLLAPAGSAQAVEYGPHVKVAKVVKDVRKIGVLDFGDVIKIRFSSPVKVTDPSSFGFQIRGANGTAIRFDNETWWYGYSYTLSDNDTLMTIKVNLIPEEMSPSDPARYTLTYPLRFNPITHTWWNGEGEVTETKVWWNICGRTECRPINHTIGDLVINKV